MTVLADSRGTAGAADPSAAWRGHRRVGWFLLVAWMAVLTVGVLTGARESTLAHLQENVESGDVDTVRISDGLSDRGRGFATVEVTWRDGVILRSTEAVEARPLKAAPKWAEEDGTPVVEPGLAERLSALDPDLRVERVRIGELSTAVLGWRLPNWVALVGLGLAISTLFLLVLGPTPWRATRWAWFWLLGLGAPVVMVAYLILGGPTSAVRPPADHSRRLTGGWAFVISLVVGSAVAPTLFG